MKYLKYSPFVNAILFDKAAKFIFVPTQFSWIYQCMAQCFFVNLFYINFVPFMFILSLPIRTLSTTIVWFAITFVIDNSSVHILCLRNMFCET
jgi:hypothetical protein